MHMIDNLSLKTRTFSCVKIFINFRALLIMWLLLLTLLFDIGSSNASRMAKDTGIPSTVPSIAEAAEAKQFTVNSDSDESDSNLDDGICATSNSNCTLRAAIEQANSTADADTIRFSIMSVTPASSLPAITQPIIIDGDTAAPVQINGQSLGGDSSGLTVLAGNSQIRGLAIGGFTNTNETTSGIVLQDAGNNLIEDCYLGTNTAGTQANPNSMGIFIKNSSNNIIRRNIISGNRATGLFVAYGASNNLIEGNKFSRKTSGT